MIQSEPVKQSSISQLIQNDSSIVANSIGVVTVSTVPSSASVTPRSRNHNRDRQQSDDKQESYNLKGKIPPKPREEFYKDVLQFHEKRSTPIMHMPKITGRNVDLHRLYCEVTERGGFQKVNIRDEWEEILPELGLKEKIVNGSAALKYIYRRILEKYERLNYFGEDPDKIDALDACEINEFIRGRGSRYPSSYSSSNPAIIHNVAMSYNYRQHHVNMDRRRQFKLSTDLYKHSPYEKLMLSMLSPLPNEQDFAINACTLMANESRHTLRLNEFPKLLDALLAHTGVFSDYSMRKMFQHIYSGVRHHSLYGFWYDLLNDKPQILDLYTDEHALREAGLIDDYDDRKPQIDNVWQDCNELHFLNLRTGLGTQDYVGQRVLQVVSILRNLSFQDENLAVLVKNKTLIRFLVMCSNIRWSNVHMQALEIAGNIAGELEVQDPTIDDLSRCLMATLCDGIEGNDRGVIINCLEIFYKLCQKETNEEYVLKCLNGNFYNTITMFLSLNDMMLLLFTLEAIYALTSLGPKSCHSIMQVKGIVDQLISLITVEAQAYGPDGCILMRVVETVPGNMLPIVAQNIANFQNVANIQKQTTTITSHNQIKPQILTPNPMPVPETSETPVEHMQQQQPHHQIQSQQQIQMSQNFTLDDEQYALAWLGATFERTVNLESHIETQELYRMYLSHCQKSGKHSVVNHLHFPKLVRLTFTAAVGPATVRKVDGTDLQGLYYVSIRLRAQPLPLQKSVIVGSGGQTTPLAKQIESHVSTRKTKKKLKQAMEVALSSPTTAFNVGNTSTQPSQAATNSTATITSCVDFCTTTSPTETPKVDVSHVESKITQPVQEVGKGCYISQELDIAAEEKMEMEEKEDTLTNLEIQTQPTTQVQDSEPPKFADGIQATQSSFCAQTQNPSTSLIKSLLANKVNQRQQKQNLNPTTSTFQGTVMDTATTVAQPIKVASTAITALVNNPLMQNTPVKVGQTTIKPLNPHPPILEKKPQLPESAPPPLAPLSGANVSKDASGRPIILANQMLVDILDKKLVDPPIPATIIQKRKIDDQVGNNKRLALEPAASAIAKEEVQISPFKNAANLYAEMAASILEDEDLEEFSTQPQQQQSSLEQQQLQQTSLIVPTKMQQQPQHQQQVAAPLSGVQRQLLFQSPQTPIKLTQPVAAPTQQIPNAVATIKTDQGLQTVPVILQQKPMEVQQQGQNQIIQHVIQTAPQQQQTYVLATNQQGQTYLVAQPTPSQSPAPPTQPTQTVLVTQTAQQQSTGQKTIIILQQQALPGQQQQIIATGSPCQGQKMIMTTSQGQQVLVTQRPQTPQQIFINPQTGTATHIQHVPVQSQPRQILQSPNTQPQQHQQPQTQQIQAGQISPSLLNQLNQIPATIKLHQPLPQPTAQNQPPQPATITRMAKNVSLVQPTNTPATPVVIPQLQQHQSIIQQHIISGPSEKRQVLLGGANGSSGVSMRAIEIKETVITQAQQPPHQCQLNSQTIITTQQGNQGTPGSSKTPPLMQQQVQQQIRAAIEQQQHPSIIQQKISTLPAMQQQHSQASAPTSSAPQQQPTNKTQNQILMQANVAASKNKTPLQQQHQTPTLKAAKVPDLPLPPIQSKSINQSQSTTQNVVASMPISSQPVGLGNVKKPHTIVKPSLPTVKLPQIINSGPPPLTAVNANSNASTTIAQTSTTTEANKKEETVRNPPQHIPSTPAGTTAKSLPTQTVTVQGPTNAATVTSSNAPTRTATPPPQQQSQINQNSTQMQTQHTAGTSTLIPTQQPQQNQQLSTVDAQWLYICDWRNCPRKKFKSMGDLQHHVCTSHAPDHLDQGADIFCQWGVGPGLCDGLPRKRFSLMTHLIDHHLTLDSLRNAVQRRIATGMYNIAPAIPPVTIVRNTEVAQKVNNIECPSTTASTSSGAQTTTCLSALQAIKRHTDLTNAKELMDENEGPVTKSIRLTASLVLRNLVTYTSTAKRSVRRYEPHLANIALSNVESSGTISNILYEMNC